VADRALPPADLLLLARIVQDRAEAADSLRGLREGLPRVGNFHGESALRTWIYRIALHEASNQRRWWMRHKRQEFPSIRSRRRDRGTPVRLTDRLVDPAESPFEMAVHAENRARSRRRYSRFLALPHTLILRDIEGFVYEDVQRYRV